MSHIGRNNLSNCKADTKNKGYQEIMFFDWKIQLEKIQLTGNLTDNTMIYQGIRLKMIKVIVTLQEGTKQQFFWFHEDTCTTFQVAKIHARMIKFHEKIFLLNQFHTNKRTHLVNKALILKTFMI